MRRITSVVLCLMLAVTMLAGCGVRKIERYPDNYETVQNNNQPVNDGQSDVQQQPVNQNQHFYTGQQYLTGIRTTHSPYSLAFDANGSKLKVQGAFANDKHNYLLVVFDNDSQNKPSVKVTNRTYSAEVDIPDIGSETKVELFGGPEEYGNFISIVIDFLRLEKVNGSWQFVNSPVYDNNVAIYTKPKDIAEALESTDRIQSDDAAIKSLSDSLTSGISNDYDKVKAIHDWVAENLYYDYDALAAGNYDNLDAKSVLISKKGVCEGYANLFAALVRAQNIPCRKQAGFALGVGTNKIWTSANINTTESNHAWNEVYLDGRWIIVDSTWDSPNKYQYGVYEKGEAIGDIYFDSTMEFFSLSHKSME